LLLLLGFGLVVFADMKEPQMAVGLENLVYQINWILAICGKVNFNRYLTFLLLVG
jgi:hypothetical protein